MPSRRPQVDIVDKDRRRFVELRLERRTLQRLYGALGGTALFNTAVIVGTVLESKVSGHFHELIAPASAFILVVDVLLLIALARQRLRVRLGVWAYVAMAVVFHCVITYVCYLKRIDGSAADAVAFSD